MTTTKERTLLTELLDVAAELGAMREAQRQFEARLVAEQVKDKEILLQLLALMTLIWQRSAPMLPSPDPQTTTPTTPPSAAGPGLDLRKYLLRGASKLGLAGLKEAGPWALSKIGAWLIPYVVIAASALGVFGKMVLKLLEMVSRLFIG